MVTEPNEADAGDDFEAFNYDFCFASRRHGYIHIEGRIFGIPNSVLIADRGLSLERKVFAAERDISVFHRIADLISETQPSSIVITPDSRRGRSPPIPP